jgi:hypothetical protein
MNNYLEGEEQYGDLETPTIIRKKEKPDQEEVLDI